MSRQPQQGLTQLISSAVLSTPKIVDGIKPTAPPYEAILGTYLSSQDGTVLDVWDLVSSISGFKFKLERGMASHLLPHSFTSVMREIINQKAPVAADHIDDSSHGHACTITFFPHAILIQPALGEAVGEGTCGMSISHKVRLLEVDAQHLRVGVIIEEDPGTTPTDGADIHSPSDLPVGWRDVHYRADVRLCALLALQGALRMLDVGTSFDSSAQETDEMVEKITTIFERDLKHSPEVDLWNQIDQGIAHGRQRFAATVRSFVQKGSPVPFILPAFPCRSTNKSKVMGDVPDMGEALAGDTLARFACAVHAVYSPGAVIHIVSDGHTFSDLVGVDDHLVDAYSDALKVMFRTYDRTGKIFQFHDLNDLLCVSTSQAKRQDGRQQTSVAALLRSMLSALWAPGDIDIFLRQSEARANQLRGLAGFMLKEQEQQPAVMAMSRKQRKRHASAAAKQMIARNEAYSKLVEFAFPRAVRLSIHPHDNRGPKYGISLLHPSLRSSMTVGANGDLISDQSAGHTPTPWHNVTLKLAGPDGEPRYALMHRSKLTELAPSTGSELVWEPVLEDNEGGYFYFSPPAPS